MENESELRTIYADAIIKVDGLRAERDRQAKTDGGVSYGTYKRLCDAMEVRDAARAALLRAGNGEAMIWS